MGGQACVLYGAAEFSRDIDLAILASALEEEEKRERDLDRQYWEPLKVELGELRRRRLG